MANWEQEAASETAAFLRREFGLCPRAAEAERRGEVLTICLTQALSPLGRVLSRDAEGVEALEAVYALLLEVHQAEIETLMTRICGTEAHQSCLELDCDRGDVRVSFCLKNQARKEN